MRRLVTFRRGRIVFDVEVNGTSFEVREVSRWEGFVKFCGPAGSIIVSDQRRGFTGGLREISEMALLAVELLEFEPIAASGGIFRALQATAAAAGSEADQSAGPGPAADGHKVLAFPPVVRWPEDTVPPPAEASAKEPL